MAGSVNCVGLVPIRASSLVGMLDALESAESRLAALRAEVGQAVALARTAPHTHDGRPCTSGLDHLPPEPPRWTCPECDGPANRCRPDCPRTE